jgi:hypothetical protein
MKFTDTILKIDHSTKAAEKNPEEWVVRGVIEVDLTGITEADVLRIISKPMKIDVQRGARMLTREDAVKHLNRRVHWTDVGKVPVDPEKARAAYKADLARMTKEERKEERLEQLKKDFGDLLEE